MFVGCCLVFFFVCGVVVVLLVLICVFHACAFEGSPIDVQFIDFELAGPNYRGFDIFKLFRRGQPPPPENTDVGSAHAAANTSSSADSSSASADSSSSPSLTSASSSPPLPVAPSVPKAAAADARALRSFVGAYLQALDANAAAALHTVAAAAPEASSS